jgi:hypothetical protein
MPNLCFLHPVGSVGQVVHFRASGVQNVDTLYFMLGCYCTDSTKSASGHVLPILCFCICWDLWVT